jgi:dynein light chain LC8-type
LDRSDGGKQDIAQHIKKQFDDRKGPTWHCIVGRNFGSFVTHGTHSISRMISAKCVLTAF